MDLRLATAVTAGKVAGVASRRLGRGGTALPGLVASRLDPAAVAKLGSALDRRLLVTGTNGKTTACHLLASIFDAGPVDYLHNREGSNMLRGFASSLVGVAKCSGSGRHASIGLFETDEATMPAAVRALRPSVMTFTNLFRDQLDRYGEVDTVHAMWREALAAAPGDATLVLNADDPSVAALANGWSGPVHTFGVDDPALGTIDGGAFDARWCRACGGALDYEARYFAHVGLWRCRSCAARRPSPDTVATALDLGLDGSRFAVAGFEAPLEIPIAGLYNVYNALAAIATARVLGVSAPAIARGLASTRPAFGRQETIALEGRRLRLLLCKNPAGANQVLAFLRSVAPRVLPLHVGVLLNDRFADGRDVSWIWDVDYELLAGQTGTAWTAGDRAEDMALRLSYAGWTPPRAAVRTPTALLDAILAGTKPGDDVFLLPTYTAMLDLRAELVRRGAVQPFWERA